METASSQISHSDHRQHNARPQLADPALVSNVAPRVPMMMSANKAPATLGAAGWRDAAALLGLRFDGGRADRAGADRRGRRGRDGRRPRRPAPAAAAARLEATWNPKGLDVSAIPGDVPGVSLFKEQFISENHNSAPAYLDGSMPGDKGFDPWGLIALAKPSLEMDKTSRTGAERETTIESMSEEERASALAWMRNSELKHARLAMLATLGWVAAEKLNAKALYFTTNGKAPSLFNGHLLDYALPLVVVFGGFAALEFLKKEEGGLGGDFGFDPLGFSTGQGPIPFDALPFEVPNVGDMTALKEAEIKNGRLAMMAITGFAVQEFIWGTPVVAQTPLFF